MTDFVENVPRMPPLAMSVIEHIGEQTLAELCPAALEKPIALDVLELAERVLPRYGINVTPASAVELGDRVGATLSQGQREIEILIDSNLWEELKVGGRIANRARATVLHEVGHAILHVPVIRRRMKSPVGQALNRRIDRNELLPYEDPEWQAWALAGCIAAPRKTIEMSAARTLDGVARVYGLSPSMVSSHLRRLKLLGRYGT